MLEASTGLQREGFQRIRILVGVQLWEKGKWGPELTQPAQISLERPGQKSED